MRREAGANLSIASCSWFSSYRIHHRAAERFQDRHAFILGDAALCTPGRRAGHEHRAAGRLQSRLEARARRQGEAYPDLLDSYAEERLPVAQRLLRTTDSGFKIVVSDSWLAGSCAPRSRPHPPPFAMSIERIQKFAFRTVSQTGINYRKSSLSKTLDALPLNAPQCGDRFPWLHLRLHAGGPVEDTFRAFDDLHFNLVAFGQSAPASSDLGYGDIVRTWTIPSNPENDIELARVGIPQPSFYLIRPDGHVGLCGKTVDLPAIAQYLAEPIGLAAA